MIRYLRPFLIEDLPSKILLLSGPRQVGKTTLSKSLGDRLCYLNYDYPEHRDPLTSYSWPRNTEGLVFDEIYKMPLWKKWIKGYYDVHGIPPWIVLTGSAQPETFTHVGDSLAGRYFHYRLHPIDLKEIQQQNLGLTPGEACSRLMTVGGFPEPFHRNTVSFYQKWRKTHLDVILRQDLLDLYAVRAILKIETLVTLLSSRVGSPISHANLANDLQVDSKTLLSWCGLLEQFYLIFSIRPFHRNIARAILKEPKYYFFDIPRSGELGARLENLVACALLKEVHFLQDTQGENFELYYVRTKDSVELDFLITHNAQPLVLFEVKTSDPTPSKAFRHFQAQLQAPFAFQLVLGLERDFDTQEGVRVRNLENFLSQWDLQGLEKM